MTKLRWYSHAGIKRYGWWTWYLQTPRFYKWGLHVAVYAFQTFGLGFVVFRDHEDDEWVGLVQLLVVEVRVTRVRYWCRREQKTHEDEYVAKYGARLVDEAEKILTTTGRKYPLNGTHYTEADDVEMLSHPEDWPSPLHVKRGHPATEHGIVNLAIRGARLIRFPDDDDRPPMHYENSAAMVADGWRID